MEWKRLAVASAVLAVLVVMTPVHGAAPDEVAKGCLNFPEHVFPYGTKFVPPFLTPGLHGPRLAYMISNPDPKPFTLSAEFPVGGVMPDFDARAVDASDATLASWTTFGDESGVVPPLTDRLYVYMPIGPDLAPPAEKGTFRWNQC